MVVFDRSPLAGERPPLKYPVYGDGLPAFSSIRSSSLAMTSLSLLLCCPLMPRCRHTFRNTAKDHRMYLPPLGGFRRAKGGGDSRLVLLMAFAWVLSWGAFSLCHALSLGREVALLCLPLHPQRQHHSQRPRRPRYCCRGLRHWTASARGCACADPRCSEQ